MLWACSVCLETSSDAESVVQRVVEASCARGFSSLEILCHTVGGTGMQPTESSAVGPTKE